MRDGQDPLIVGVSGPLGGPWEVRSPAVGWWSAAPQNGEVLLPGSRVGRLKRLNRFVELHLPAGHAGRVEGVPRARVVAVGYRDPLFRLVALESGGAGVAHEPQSDRADLPAGQRAVVSPTDGVFYRRPDPASLPLIEVGDRLRVGQPIGLVEVMKTFHQIAYGGPGLPEEAEVVEIRRGDGEEVAAGDVLVVVR